MYIQGVSLQVSKFLGVAECILTSRNYTEILCQTLNGEKLEVNFSNLESNLLFVKIFLQIIVYFVYYTEYKMWL